jgi:peptidylprolyl isomerase
MIARYGDTVKVHYQGTADRGTIFGTRHDGEALEFTVGQGQVITGFEEAVVGMHVGEEKTVEIPMDKAFGRWDDGNVVVVDREKLPPSLTLEVGKHLCIRTGDGRRAVVAVAGILDSTVTLNANHPLSGKDLTFRIRLLEIVR